MNVTGTLEILQTLKAMGATHFKCDDFEVTIDKNGQISSIPQGTPAPPIAVPVSPTNPDATAKLKELMTTLSLPNERLVDTIFPNGAGG